MYYMFPLRLKGRIIEVLPQDSLAPCPPIRVLAAEVQPLYCTLRMRLRCEIRADDRLLEVHTVLNEVVIDRGAYPGPAVLDLFVDQSYVTTGVDCPWAKCTAFHFLVLHTGLRGQCQDRIQ